MRQIETDQNLLPPSISSSFLSLSTPVDKRHAAELRRELSRQFTQNQNEIAVPISTLGEQTATCTSITPSHLRSSTPIMVFPGISGDIHDVRRMIIELAIHYGQPVHGLSYPESPGGSVTEAFTRATEAAPLATHEAFFTEGITQLIPDAEKDAVAFSTGATILARMLTKPEMQVSVREATFYSAAGWYDQPDPVLNHGIMYEIAQTLKYPPQILRNRFSFYNTEQRARIFAALRKAVRQRDPAWDKLNTATNKSVAVRMTKDRMMALFPWNLKNPHLQIIRLPGGHNTPIHYPERVVPRVQAYQAQLPVVR